MSATPSDGVAGRRKGPVKCRPQIVDSGGKAADVGRPLSYSASASSNRLPVVVGVTSRYRIRLAAFGEFFERVGARRLEQPIMRTRVVVIGRDERLRDQVRDTVDDVRCGDLGARRDRARCLQRESRRRRSKGDARPRARARRAAHSSSRASPAASGAAAGQCGDHRSAGGNDRRAAMRPRPSRARRRGRPRARSPAGCRRGAGRLPLRRAQRVRREVRIRRARPRDEQPNRAVSQQSSISPGASRRHSERRHPVKALTLDSQRLAARRHHTRCRVGAQQRLGHARRRVDHMLAIVEQQHRAASRRAHWRRARAVTAPPLRSSPSAVATVTGTRSGSDSGASSATHTPSANSASRCRATSRPRRVLPIPPSPIRVTSRCVVTRSVTSESSASRPISSDTVSGRFVRGGRRLGGGHRGRRRAPARRQSLTRISPVNW